MSTMLTTLLPLAAAGDGIATLILGIVNVVVLVIFIYVLLDLAQAFTRLPEPLVAIHDGLAQVCEPLFAPVRSVLPPMGGIDFSPLITLIVIQVVGRALAAVFV